MRRERRLAWVLIFFLIFAIPSLLVSILISGGFGLIFFDIFGLLVLLNAAKERWRDRKLKIILQTIASVLIVTIGILWVLRDLDIYDAFEPFT